MKSPCLSCGELTTATRCPDCERWNDRARIRTEHSRPRQSSTARGYDRQWRVLSERARREQPFCSKCGATDDLQTDHTPEAWRRKDQGLPIRLRDVDVLCGPCNRAAGAARGESVTRSATASRASAVRRRNR